MADKEKAVDDVVDNFFDNILHTKMHTKNKKWLHCNAFLVFMQGFDSPHLHHVGASDITLAPTYFIYKPERTHAATPGYDFDLETRL